MTTSTTLIDELLEAAQDADLSARYCEVSQVSGADEHRAKAARLRARAERVRELASDAEAELHPVDSYNLGWDDAVKALTGALPTPGEP